MRTLIGSERSHGVQFQSAACGRPNGDRGSQGDPQSRAAAGDGSGVGGFIDKRLRGIRERPALPLR